MIEALVSVFGAGWQAQPARVGARQGGVERDVGHAHRQRCHSCCAYTDADLCATAAELAQGSFGDLAWAEERALAEGPAAFAPLMGMARNFLGDDRRMAPGIQLAPGAVLRLGVALLVPLLLVVALWFTQAGARVRTSGLDCPQIVVGREIQRWASWTNRSCCNATGSTWGATTAWAKPG